MDTSRVIGIGAGGSCLYTDRLTEKAFIFPGGYAVRLDGAPAHSIFYSIHIVRQPICRRWQAHVCEDPLCNKAHVCHNCLAPSPECDGSWNCIASLDDCYQAGQENDARANA